MTETRAASQADTDAATYEAFTANGENKAATARALGINAGTVAERVKRHQARAAQDDAAQDDRDPFDEILASDPELRDLRDNEYVPDAPADEDGEPAAQVTHAEAVQSIGDAIDRASYAAYTAALEALARGEDTYVGTGCPECHAVAWAYQGGHQLACKYGKRPAAAPAPAPAAAATEAPAAATAEPAPAVTPEPAATAPAGEHDGLHAHCVKCGWDFGHAISQATCGSAKMCERRKVTGNPNLGRRRPAVTAPAV